AVRIARDESIGAGNALGFATSNLRSFVLAPIFIAAAAAFFLGLAALAGVVSGIPYAGPFLEIVMLPLAFVCGLVLLVIAVGGVFGYPMMQAAVATERNGTLDAVSRTFSYVFTRPVAYLTSLVMLFVVATLVATFGLAFLNMTARAVTFGAGQVSDDSSAAIGAGMDIGYKAIGLFSWPQVRVE